MSLKDLSKEQKQYLVLGALALVILVVLLVLGIRFSLSSINDAKTELMDLSSKIEAADRTLKNKHQVTSDFMRTMNVLQDHLDRAPPQRNYYSWATEVVYSEARMVGLEIDSIDEITALRNKTPQDSANGVRFESYALRVTAHGGFENIKLFIRNLKKSYPLVRFTGLDISSGQDPEAHNIQIWMQWPFSLGSIQEKWNEVLTRRKQLDLPDPESVLNVESNAPVVQGSQPMDQEEPAAVAGPVEVLSAEPVTPEPETKPEPTPPPPRVTGNEPVPSRPFEPAVEEPVPELPKGDTSVLLIEEDLDSDEPGEMVPAGEPMVTAVEEAIDEPVTEYETTEADAGIEAVVEDTPAEENQMPAEATEERIVDVEPSLGASAAGIDAVGDSLQPQPAEPVDTPDMDSVSPSHEVADRSVQKFEELLENPNTMETNEAISSLLDSLLGGGE